MTNAEQLISSLNQQYGAGSLRRNMEIMLWYRVGKLSQTEIARKYHLSRERVSKIISVWTELLASINQNEGNGKGGSA